MKFRLLFISIFISFNFAYSQNYTIVKFDKIQKILKSRNDTLYVLNFWANWSKECEKELPLFDELTEIYKGKKLKVIMICVDEMQDKEEWVDPFLLRMQLKSEVWWLDQDINLLKQKVERNWVGDIPFTLIFRGKTHEKHWRQGVWKKKKLVEKVEEML